MQPDVAELITRIAGAHPHETAGLDAHLHIQEFERRSGFALPADMRAFYLQVRSAELADTYRLLPVTEFVRTGVALLGDEWIDSEPQSWYAFCDVHDGNYVGIDLMPAIDGGNDVLDCDHEDIANRRVVARSFMDFVARALDSTGSLYYLESSFVPIRWLDVPHRPPKAWLRSQHLEWALVPEVGPETCYKPGCSRRRIQYSLLCRHHQFEQNFRAPYPFDE